MDLHAIGIDLGKTIFHLVGLSRAGEVVVRKKFSRTQLLRFTSNLQVDLIEMEACVGSHFLDKALREQGHQVRLMPAQCVKPFVKTNNNDFIDAEAIAEALIHRPISENFRQGRIQMASSCPHSDASLQQQTADLVYHCGAPGVSGQLFQFLLQLCEQKAHRTRKSNVPIETDEQFDMRLCIEYANDGSVGPVAFYSWSS